MGCIIHFYLLDQIVNQDCYFIAFSQIQLLTLDFQLCNIVLYKPVTCKIGSITEDITNNFLQL